MAEFVEAARLEQIPPGTGTMVKVADKEIAIFNVGLGPFFQTGPSVERSVHRRRRPVYVGNVLSPKLAELLSIAFDASVTHMYAPGTRRHIKAALKHGATIEEIMEVLKICVAEGVQPCNLGVPMLAAEIAELSTERH